MPVSRAGASPIGCYAAQLAYPVSKRISFLEGKGLGIAGVVEKSCAYQKELHGCRTAGLDRRNWLRLVLQR